MPETMEDCNTRANKNKDITVGYREGRGLTSNFHNIKCLLNTPRVYWKLYDCFGIHSKILFTHNLLLS